MRRLCSAAVLLALLSGCASLSKTPATLNLAHCATQTTETFEQLNSNSDSQTLACALEAVRLSQDPAVLRSATGSRLCLLLAEREANAGQREKLAAEGVTLAERAVAHGGEGDGAVHYYLSANLGLAIRDHLSLAIANLSRLESEMRRAWTLNPDVDDGGPLRLLGALYLKAPAWPKGIGDRDKALELLKQAVQKHPKHPLNHLFYGQALWAENEQDTQAKTEFALGAKLLSEGGWGYSQTVWQREFDEFQQEAGWTKTKLPVAQAIQTSR
jgi:hypothetical protein